MPEDLAKLTVKELKARLKAKGLPVSGNKAALVARLQAPLGSLPGTVPTKTSLSATVGRLFGELGLIVFGCHPDGYHEFDEDCRDEDGDILMEIQLHFLDEW